MAQTLTLIVNGQTHQVQADPETPLLYILRNNLGLVGAKFACGLEQCGACKVLIDGEDQPSCRVPVKSVQGREITTLEGIGSPVDLHPLQKAFIEEQAIQCGFCAGGMIVAAKALLDRTPRPSENEIRTALRYHLCRCGAHQRIIKAIQRAAEEMTS